MASKTGKPVFQALRDRILCACLLWFTDIYGISTASFLDEAAKEDEPDNEQDVRASYASDGLIFRWN